MNAPSRAIRSVEILQVDLLPAVAPIAPGLGVYREVAAIDRRRRADGGPVITKGNGGYPC